MSKEIIIEQAKNIVLSKQPTINISKFLELEFSLLIWQTKILQLTKHQFEDGLASHMQSYFILFEGEAVFQIVDINTHQIDREIQLQIDIPFYYGLEYQSNSTFCQIIAKTNCKISIIKDSRIQQIIKNYFSLCEHEVLEALCRQYFLQNESGVFISTLLFMAKKRKLQKGIPIYKLQEQVDGFYLVLEGEVCVISLIPNVTSGKLKQKKIIQKILNKDQCFGEVELFNGQQNRSEQTECYSLECEILHISTATLLEAYRNKTQDQNYSLQNLQQQFRDMLKIKENHQMKTIARHKYVNQPPEQPKPPMKATDPLFMDLTPLTQFKYSIQSRTHSLYQSKILESQPIKRMASQEVLVNESLAKLNRLEGLHTVKNYIEQVKGMIRPSGVSKYNWDKSKPKHIVVTEKQQQLLDYARQMSPLIQQRKPKLSLLSKSVQLPKQLNYTPKKNSVFIMLPDRRY